MRDDDAPPQRRPQQPAPLRVCLVANALGVGGVERQLVQTARALRSARWPTTLVALRGRGSDHFAAAMEPLVDAVVLLGDERLSDLGRVRALRTWLDRVDAQVAYSLTAKPNVMNVLAGLGRPRRSVVWGIRDTPGWRETEGLHRSRRVERALSGRPDEIIFNSHAGQRQYRSLGYRRTGVVVHNGIDTHAFRPADDARVSLRRDLGLPQQARIVGMAGRLHAKKGVDVFVEAARLVAPQRPEVSFVHVGGPAGQDVRPPGGSADVRFLGHRDDMPTVLAGLDVLCLPSVYGEGFPNVVAEAMSCGVPCVVTPAGDAAEIVGGTGVVVAAHDAAALAAATVDLLDRVADQRATLSAACRGRIVERYSTEVFGRRLTSALAGVAASAPGPDLVSTTQPRPSRVVGAWPARRGAARSRSGA